MIYIDKCAYNNRLTNIHPFEKFIFALITMVICLASKSFVVPVLVLFTMAYITVFKAKIPLMFYSRMILMPLGFLILGILSVLINNVSNSQHVLLHMNIFNFNLGITTESLKFAALLFLRSLGSISCLYFLSLTTPLVDLISVLRKLKFPELFIELMTFIYKLIFILVMTAGEIHTSQSSRLGYSTIKNQYRSLSQLISSLFVVSYRKVNDLFMALEARCYNGKLNVLEKYHKLSPVNVATIVLIDILLVFIELTTT